MQYNNWSVNPWLDKVNDDTKLVVFGAGSAGVNNYNVLTDLGLVDKVVAVCDNDVKKQGQKMNDISIVSVDEAIKKYSNAFFVISTSWWKEANEQLLKGGIPEEQICHCDYQMDEHKILGHCDNQYFDLLKHKTGKREIFVDGGCYDGSSTYDFVKWCNGEYDKIYAFEPDPKLLDNCEKNIKSWGFDNITIVNKGLYSYEGELRFFSNGTAGKIQDDGDIVVPVIDIDTLVNGNPVTFIKMDIEGSELKALQGTEQTIKKHKPTLAICVYHKKEDIIQIPNYILSIVPEYKLYLRHYSNHTEETVLYATVSNE